MDLSVPRRAPRDPSPPPLSFHDRLNTILHSSLRTTMKIAALLLWSLAASPFTSGFVPSRVAAQACPSSSLSSTTRTSEDEAASTSSSNMPTPLWFQKQIVVTAPSRGCHLITNNIMKAVGSDMQQINIGMANLFIQHTSASLTINENADPDVRTDMETALNKIVPAQWNRDGTFKHTLEGDDDMPGHVKSSLMGVSLNIPISNGRLALGTWQGVYLNEHRDQGGFGGGHARRIVITLQGQSK